MGMKFNPLTGQLDMVQALKVSELITQAELQVRITASTLVAGQWYIITDYQTVGYIRGTTTMRVGDVEQIMVQASAVNKIRPQGYSVDNPEEIIFFDQSIKKFYVDGAAEYDDGDTDGDWVINPINSTQFTITGDALPASSGWTSFYVYIEDYDSGDEFEGDLSNMGTEWSFDETTQTFTLIGADVDLTDPVWIEFEVSYPLAQTAEGVVYKRERPKNNLVIADDYRGVLCRRYKCSCTTWTAGTTSANQVRRYGGYIWSTLKSTTDTPSTSSSDWLRMFADDYVLSDVYANYGIAIYGDSSDYQDLPMFTLADLDSLDKVLNINLDSNSDGNVNIRFVGNITNTTEVDVVMGSYGATIVDGANSLCGVLSRSILGTITDVKITDIDSVVINVGTKFSSHTVRNSTCTNLQSSRAGYMTGTRIRGTLSACGIGELNGSLFAGNVEKLNAIRYFNNKHYGNMTRGNFVESYSNVFNDDVEDVFSSGAFYSNTWASKLLRCQFASKCYSNTLHYWADNSLFGNVTNNIITGANSNVINNIVNGAFDNNNLTHADFRLDGNTFGSFERNNGAGKGIVTKNSFSSFYKGNKFNAGGTTSFTGNTGVSFGGTTAQGADFATTGDVWIDNNFFGGYVKYLDIDSGAQLTNNTFLGNTSTFDLKNSGQFNENEIGTKFDSNTCDGVIVEKCKFPSSYSGVILINKAGFSFFNDMEIKLDKAFYFGSSVVEGSWRVV